LCDVSGADSLSQPFDCDASHVGLELRPTFETIRARKHKLGIVQSEFRTIRVAVQGVYLPNSVRVSGDESFQQFFCLPLELIEIGSLRK